MKKITFYFLSFLLLLLFSGCYDNGSTESTKNNNKVVKKDRSLGADKNVVLSNIDGETTPISLFESDKRSMDVVIEKYKGKVVFLNFWGTFCPPCIAEIPHLNELQKKYKEDLIIIGVLAEKKDLNELKTFVKEKGIEYIITSGDANFDLAEYVGGVRGIPAMFLYNKNGIMERQYVGTTPTIMIENDIKKLLNKN